MTLHPLARRLAALEQAAELPDAGMTWLVSPEGLDAAGQAEWHAQQRAAHPGRELILWTLVDVPTPSTAALATPDMENTAP